MSMNADCFWDWLENLQLAADESCLNKVSPNSIMIKDFLDPCIQLLTSSIENPVNLENKNEMGDLVSLLDEMKQLCAALSTSDSVIENHVPIELSKKILSRRSKVAHILNKLFLLCKRNTNVEHEPSQASNAASNDDNAQNDVEESKDNSKGAINSGQGNNTKNNKGKKNKGKKNLSGLLYMQMLK